MCMFTQGAEKPRVNFQLNTFERVNNEQKQKVQEESCTRRARRPRRFRRWHV